MNQNVSVQPSKVKAVFLIRDKDGNPRFDDPNNIHPEIMAMLTPKDLEYLEQLRNQ